MIHYLAHVDASVLLGEGTRIWQFASVTRGTIMGRDCSVSPGAMLDGSVYGDRVVISGGVRAGAGFKVGNDVFLGPNVTLCNDMWPTVDKGGYDDEALRSGRFAVVIGNGASVGANAVVLPGVRVGAGAMIAAGAVCNRSVPAGHLFTRHEEIVEIKPQWRKRRMRFVA